MQDETSPQQQQKEYEMTSAPFAKRQRSNSVYVAALTDNLVVVKLKENEASKRNRILLKQVLLDICEQFTLDLLLDCISSDKHPSLIAFLLIILTRPDSLNEQRMLCIFMFSFILGGACWNGSVKLLDSMDKDKLSQFLKVLVLNLANDSERKLLTAWANTTSTLKNNNSNVDDRLLVLSFAVQLDDQAFFVEFTNLFLKVSASEFFKQQKICVNDYLQLAADVQEHSVFVIITNHKEEFMMQSLCEWKVLINKYQVKSVVEDGEQVQSFIEELSDKYGGITEDLLKTDLTLNQDCILCIVVHTSEKKPKKSQLALPHYCAESYLMKRDRAAFAEFWALLGYDETWIQYHADCNITPVKGELVIINEADQFMLNLIEEFMKLVNQYACLCFTGAPDNCYAKGAEAKVRGMLALSKFDFMIEPKFKPVKNIADLQMDENVQAATLGEDNSHQEILSLWCKHAKMTLVNAKPFINRERQCKALLEQVGPTMCCMVKLQKIQTMVIAVQVEAMSKGFTSRQKICSVLEIRKPNQHLTMLSPQTSSI
ncbi:UNKNOWN [Stylonychia lemnae]|uniref:Uncharacterized protein n=1 Tax=Stylonychia lemnae TaxID=5949 RepID=A0A077ZRW3_STYLE|nr:UNKNOWN [Stylonychia lemnae]|eukprot:CDW71226.1 UNKNOWN [Stylonychia lemnae]